MELILLRPLWLLALLPWLWQGWRRRRQRPLLAPAMQAYLLPARGRAIPWLWLATLPVILALSGPALRQQSQTVSSPALDIWLLDLSSSMQARDLPPDRATRVRLLLQDMLAEAAARQAPHPLGLILFAGDAYLAMPPTRDHQAIALLLPDLRPAIMPVQGSAPERAVALAGRQPFVQAADRRRRHQVAGGMIQRLHRQGHRAAGLLPAQQLVHGLQIPPMGFFGALAVQALQHGGAPQVFQQHETLGLIPGQDGWHTQTSSVCQCLNLDEGAAVFLVWWGIHDDQAAAVGAV